MDNRHTRMMVVIAAWILSFVAHASGMDAIKGNWEIAPEASKMALAERDGLSEDELNELDSKFAHRFETQSPTLSIDHQRIGLLIGNKTILLGYQVIEETDYSIRLELTIEGKTVPGRIELLGPQWIRLAMGGDYDWYVWQRSDGDRSALDDAFVQPPSTDTSGNSPEYLFQRMASLADNGDYTAMLALHSPASQERNSIDSIENRWTSFRSGLGIDDLQVQDVTVMAQHPGVWLVQGRYRDGKQKGPVFSLFFREIDGNWKAVSRPEFQ